MSIKAVITIALIAAGPGMDPLLDEMGCMLGQDARWRCPGQNTAGPSACR